MTALRTAAQQALEALEYNRLDVGKFNRINAACQALRAALKQEEEASAWLAERNEYWRKEKEKMQATNALRAALAQQAEPVDGACLHGVDDGACKECYAANAEPVARVASKDGRVIYDNAFTHDVVLRVAGDFEDDEQRARYAQRIVDKLNAALAQRKPLTEEEIYLATGHCGVNEHTAIKITRAVEQAHEIKE